MSASASASERARERTPGERLVNTKVSTPRRPGYILARQRISGARVARTPARDASLRSTRRRCKTYDNVYYGALGDISLRPTNPQRLARIAPRTDRSGVLFLLLLLIKKVIPKKNMLSSEIHTVRTYLKCLRCAVCLSSLALLGTPRGKTSYFWHAGRPIFTIVFLSLIRRRYFDAERELPDSGSRKSQQKTSALRRVLSLQSNSPAGERLKPTAWNASM